MTLHDTVYTAKERHRVKIVVFMHFIRCQQANKVSSARRQGRLCRQAGYAVQDDMVSCVGKQGKLCEAHSFSCCVHAVYTETGGC